jgi:hypothetical protein
MSQGDWHILVIVGGVLLLLGILGIIWGMREEQKLFDALSKKPDLREFSLKHLDSPQPGALKTGGWIAIGIGLVLIIIGIVLWQTGWPPG